MESHKQVLFKWKIQNQEFVSKPAPINQLTHQANVDFCTTVSDIKMKYNKRKSRFASL